MSFAAIKTGILRRGFTLIELIIVVAIIALLVLIAAPNIQEVDTRTKVARLKSDLATTALALEVFQVDHGHYPNCLSWHGFAAGRAGELFPRCLQEPINYLGAKPKEVFEQNRTFTYHSTRYYFEKRPYGLSWEGHEPRVWDYLAEQRCEWLLNAYGPGRDPSIPRHCSIQGTGWSVSVPKGYRDRLLVRSYDPTNGTVSSGNLLRASGDVRLSRR